MRKDHRNSLDPELDLYDTAFMSYSLHKMYQSVEGITLRGDMVDLFDNPLKRCARTIGTRWIRNWTSTTPRS